MLVYALAGLPTLTSQQQQQVADSAAAVKRKSRQIPVVAGIVKATPWDPNADVSISIFPRCSAHAHMPGASCGQACPLRSLNSNNAPAQVLRA